MDGTAKVVCTTVSGIITALVLGEVFGNAISRPIAAWRGGNDRDIKRDSTRKNNKVSNEKN